MSEILRVAASQIGVKESPAGSNRQKYGKWYGMNGQPWCDMFVSWCAFQAGESKAVGKYAYCPSHVAFFKRQGRWLDRNSKPQPGDIVFFASRGTACHVGIVEKRLGAYAVQTIEGNTSTSSNDNGGKVMRRKRAYGRKGSNWYILGFGRPAYSGGSSGGSSSVKTVQKWVGVSQDGIYGSQTKKALVKKLQSELNKQTGAKLEVDGIFGAKTKKACINVHKGHKGNITKTLQGVLICRGYYHDELDGAFGDATLKAVKNFQRKHGLVADGIAGKNTWAKLFA
jgi:peptidoglycan hydrolase-like protein with peptidoglycan-binding domain